MTPHEFAALAGEFFSKNPFYESEIGRESNTFGAVTAGVQRVSVEACAERRQAVRARDQQLPTVQRRHALVTS